MIGHVWDPERNRYVMTDRAQWTVIIVGALLWGFNIAVAIIR